MKKNYLLSLITFCFISTLTKVSAQYCGSLRYDTEVFQNIQTTSDITFGANTGTGGGTTTLKLDVYEPDGDTLAMRPMIVWVHGGSFVGGTKTDGDVVSLCQHFAKRGYVCASIEYRLGFSNFPPTATQATETVFRAVQDMKAAIRFFRKDAATTNSFRIDPSTIFGGGSSAGALTALHLAYLDEPSEIPVGVDTNSIGGLEGNSGNPGYSSEIKAVVNLCGALGEKTWIHPGDEPLVSMHGTTDNVVPYSTATIYLLTIYPIMVVDGSYAINQYADSIGLTNEMYTYYGSGHVPYASNLSIMDTTVRFVSNFLYQQLGCSPSDPFPLANTFPVGISSISSDQNISIYPNPGTGKFIFTFSDLKNENELSVYDMSGRKLVEKNNILSGSILDLSELSSGVYFYSVKNENKFYSGKLIKQ